MDKEYNYMVCIDCMTYNQASYIKDTLNGFSIQETNFPFVCTIIDDASTDGEQEVIKKYLQEQFDLSDKSVVRNEETEEFSITFVQHKTNKNCFFAVLYLKFNHYSIRKPKYPYVKEWRTNCKYIAMCEGDDIWIDPLKLQKQVDFLNGHPECTLYVSNGVGYYEKEKKSVRLNPIQTKESKYLTMSEVLREKGGLIPTASMCFRREMMETEPEWCLNAPVGDRPLRMWCASHGKIYYDVTPMVVYRKSSIGSFTQHVNADYNYARHILDEMNVFYDAFDKYTHQEYKDDVQYMKDREEYSFYSRVRDFNSLFHCSFFYNKSWLERIKIHVKIQFPFVYKILYKIKSAIRLYSPLNMH